MYRYITAEYRVYSGILDPRSRAARTVIVDVLVRLVLRTSRIGGVMHMRIIICICTYLHEACGYFYRGALLKGPEDLSTRAPGYITVYVESIYILIYNAVFLYRYLLALGLFDHAVPREA